MRPLSLTIEGLTSFKSPQDVDLSDLDLFVITGPTGAGKSSILDAITFALYGSIARVNGRELRDLISHGSSYMRVRLDFQVDGQRYRVARRMSRTAHDATLERVEGDAVSPEVDRGGVRDVNSRLEEIVGLDFKAFTRAVLLPQGAFHEFLTGDGAERRRILMRLLDLGRYEFVGQAARREATRLDAVIGERRSLIESNYQEATAERLADLTAALGASLDRSTKVEEARGEAKAKANEAAGLLRTRDALAESATKLDGSLDALEGLAAAWGTLDGTEKTARETLIESEKALDGATKARAQAEKAVERTVVRNGDAATLATAAAAAKTRTESLAELEKLTAELGTAEEATRTLSAALETAREAEAQARTSLDQHTARREAAEATKAKAEAVSRWAAASASVGRLDDELPGARDGAALARAALDQARSHERHVRQDHAALVIRAALVPGDPCPVCDTVVDVLLARPDGAGASLESAAAAVEAAETTEQLARAVVVALETQRTAAADEMKQARKLVPKGEALPVANADADADAAEAALAEAVSALAGVVSAETAARTALEKAVGAAAKAETKSSTGTTKVEAAAKGRDGAQSRLKSALATLKGTLGAKLPDDPMAEISHRRDELTAAEAARSSAAQVETSARGTRDEARNAHAATTEGIIAFDRDLVSVCTLAGIACETVADLLPDAGLPASLAPDLGRAEALAAWRKACEGHATVARQSIARLEKQVEAAVRGLVRSAEQSGVELDEQTVPAIVQRFDEAATAAHGAVVAAEKDVAETQRRIEERKNLEQEIADDRRLAELHQALARELRADNFIAFVLEESMSGLASHASDELREISNGRYSLRASQGSFAVVDHHNADERRSVATLSGGETFLASLSLALALSAGLRELAGAAAARLEAIFIDEGFGALDPETLEVVVDALERLRETDRMVGVITHVAALADRIPSGLLVERRGSSSCVVTR